MTDADVLGRLREAVSAMKAKSGSPWQSSLSSYVNGRDDTIRAVLALIDADLQAAPEMCVHCGDQPYGRGDDACWWCYARAKDLADAAIGATGAAPTTEPSELERLNKDDVALLHRCADCFSERGLPQWAASIRDLLPDGGREP